jgi:ubiquinone/menaquinone biosynthesis C-methylase UbiE
MSEQAPGERLKDQQRHDWDAAAAGWEKWDAWLQRQTQSVTDWLCRAAGHSAGKQAIDLACGSGQPALTAARRVKPGGKVVAVDISAEMVAIARRKARQADLDNVEFQEMDLENLQFPDGSFDAATCRWGLMFCPAPVRAAAEIRRVLKPGARLAAAVWDEPAKNPFFTLIQGPLAQFRQMPAPDPKAPGVFRLAPPGELEAILRGAGFSTVEVEPRSFAWEYGSPEEYWQSTTEIAAPLKAAVASLSPEDAARLKEAVLGEVAKYRQAGRVRIPAVTLCAWAQK